jgi:hypothetical protein
MSPIFAPRTNEMRPFLAVGVMERLAAALLKPR